MTEPVAQERGFAKAGRGGAQGQLGPEANGRLDAIGEAGASNKLRPGRGMYSLVASIGVRTAKL